MTVLNYPALIHERRDARNGMVPCTEFYGAAVNAENHIVLFRKKEIFRWVGYVGSSDVGAVDDPATASKDHSRFHFHTGYGATKLTAYAILGVSSAGTTAPYVRIAVTIPGGATSTFSPDMRPGGTENAFTDAPNEWGFYQSDVTVAPNTTYEGLITQGDYARILGLVIYEEASAVSDDSVDYFNEQQPQAAQKIFDAHRQRLLGTSNMWKRNGGLICHWSQEGFIERSRTSATAINLIDNSTTGTPTANTPGWTIDGAYRTTLSRSVISAKLAVYASMSSGSGTVRITDTGGTSAISVTVNNATPQWFTGTGTIVAATGKKYDPMFLSDGTNVLEVYAVSLYEYEA